MKPRTDSAIPASSRRLPRAFVSAGFGLLAALAGSVFIAGHAAGEGTVQGWLVRLQAD